jgi:putative ABC transport system permease protein
VIAKLFIKKEFSKFPFFFILLMITLFMGTLGLVSIGTVSNQVQEKLKASAQELLTSDLAVSARRDLFDHEKEKLKILLAQYPHQSYRIIDLYSMVFHLERKASRLVEIRSTEMGFPFYGQIKLNEGTFSSEYLYVSKDLAELWGVRPGDQLKIGESLMTVKAIVIDDSSQGLRGISLAPRIYFPFTKLSETGLLKPGATGSFAFHFKLKNKNQDLIQSLKKQIYTTLTDPAVKITLPQDSSDQTGRVIEILTNFMSLSSLIGLILSLVGVFYLYQSHLQARLKDFCLFNLHGLAKEKIILGIVVQFSLVFCVVIFLELILAGPFYHAIRPVLTDNLGLELDSQFNLASSVTNLPFLFILSLFILVPLLLGLLRTPMGVQLKASKLSMGTFRFYDFLPFFIVLWLFSCKLAHSFKIGNLFFVALLMVFAVSAVILKLGQILISRFIRHRGLLLPFIESGIALRSLARSGHKLTLSFLSLAMGMTLISLILQLDKMILKEFTMDTKKPSLFLFDIQEEQLDQLIAHAKELKTSLAFITPMIRARLEKVNDKKFIRQKKSYDFRSREEDEDARLRNNTINLTYRDYLTEAEKIIEGSPFPQGGLSEDRLPYISIEKRWSERMGIHLGDKLTFDVQGVEFQGIVRNIKEVKWTTFYPNFFVTIEPGIIDAAPKTFLAILPSTKNELKRNFQRSTVLKFSNISFIDVEELVLKISVLFEKSRKAIEFISWLSLAVGLLILYGLCHDQVYRRHYDLALLKTLGLSARELRLNLIFEFGPLFLAALSLGLFLGWAIALIIGREIFKLTWSIDWISILAPAGLLIILCLVTILLSSWKAVATKPRELLSDS